MTVTHVQISQEEQELLIKMAAQKKISVEALASAILGQGVQGHLANLERGSEPTICEHVNPLAGLQPYRYDASPEESVLESDDWNMES